MDYCFLSFSNTELLFIRVGSDGYFNARRIASEQFLTYANDGYKLFDFKII